MTQPKLLELAKQGEPQAIATLMNRSLQPQGMAVKVTREGDRLSVLLQADQTPNRLVMTNFVRNGITNLKLESVIHSVEIIGQRTGEEQPAWVQELQLSEMNNYRVLETLDSSSSVIESANSDAASLESLLESDPAITSTETLGSTGDASAIADDFNLEDAGLFNEGELTFDDDPLAFDDSPSNTTLEFETADEATDFDLDLSDTSDFDALDLGGDQSSDISSFDFNEEDPSEFSTLDLEATPPADDERLSLFADLDESNDLGLGSSDSSSVSSTDDVFADSSLDALDSPIDAASDPASDLFGLDSSPEETPEVLATDEPSDLFGLESANDDAFASEPFDTSDGTDSFDSFGLETADNSSTDDFSLSVFDDGDSESDFNASPSDDLFLEDDLAAALTESSDADPVEPIESNESNEFDLGALDEGESSPDSDFFGELESLDLSTDESLDTSDWESLDGDYDIQADEQPGLTEPSLASEESSSDFASEESSLFPDENPQSEDLGFASSGMSDIAEIPDEVAALFSETDSDIEPFEALADTSSTAEQPFAQETPDMFTRSDLEANRLATEDDLDNLFENDSSSSDDSTEVGYTGSALLSDEALGVDELSGAETLSNQDLELEITTSEFDSTPAEADIEFNAMSEESTSEDWSTLNASGDTDLSDTGFNASPIDASFGTDLNDTEFSAPPADESLSDLDLTLDIAEGTEWTEDTTATPESSLESDQPFLDLDLNAESEPVFSADVNTGAIADLDLSGDDDEQAFLSESAFLGDAAFPSDWVDESPETGELPETGDRTEEVSFADDGAEFDLSEFELDNTALNDFADSSEELDASRFDLTSGDLDDDVESASGFVVDTETALPPEFTESESLGADLSPMDSSLESDLSSAIAPERETDAEVVSPIADLTPLADDQTSSDQWMDTQDALIDEEAAQFDINDEREPLDPSPDTDRLDVEDEIILTPDFHDEDAENWDDLSAVELDDAELSSESLDPQTAPQTPAELAALATAEQSRSLEEDETSSPPRHSEPPEHTSNHRGLLAVIAALIGIWLLALLAISLFRRDPSPVPSVATQEPGTAESPAVDPDEPANGITPAPENAFQEGLAKGLTAANLAQTAQSADDWGLVVSQWQQAIDLFEVVPESSPDYETAQQKITEYENNLAIAQQRLASVPETVDAPATAPALIVAGDVTCQAIAPDSESPSIELSNIQVTDTRLVGCLTNHTELPVNAVSVVYQQTRADAEDAPSQALGRLDIQTIQPGETQPFQSDFVLADDVEEATVQSIVWSSPTMSEPQQEDVQVSAAPQ